MSAANAYAAIVADYVLDVPMKSSQYDFIDEDVKSFQIVTDIDCVDKIGQVILSHLTSIDKSWIDILEIPADCNWSEDTVDQIKSLIDSGIP